MASHAEKRIATSKMRSPHQRRDRCTERWTASLKTRPPQLQNKTETEGMRREVMRQEEETRHNTMRRGETRQEVLSKEMRHETKWDQ